NSPCQFLSTLPGIAYGPGNCDQIGDQIDGELSVGTHNHNRKQVVSDSLEVGDKLCYTTWVKPYAHNQSGWAYSSARCVTVGKRPKLQVLGGDVITAGSIQAGVTTKVDGDYGSWGEYGLLAGGDVM